MREPDAFFRWIAPYAPSCPDPVMERHVIDATRSFCEATRCWRATDSIAITGDEEQILCVDASATLFEIEQARFNERDLEPVSYTQVRRDDEGEPRLIAQVNPQAVILSPHGEAGTLTISMFLKPAQDAQSLPDFLFEQFGEFIAQGALATILSIPNLPYSNPGLAAYNAARFQQAKDSRFAFHRRGQQRAPVRTRAQYL